MSYSMADRISESIPRPIIPGDTLVEVLLRLPVKSLMRFKCVSKQWFFLITNTSFVDLYQSRSYAKKSIFFLVRAQYGEPDTFGGRCFIMNGKKKTVKWYDLPFCTNLTSNIVNGLICFFHQIDMKDCISIYNLTTREYLHLPPIWNACVERIFDLGFDPINKKYKVLHIWWRKHGVYEVECQVFTIRGKYNRWRQVDMSYISRSFTDIIGRRSELGFYHEGFLYWTLGLVHEHSRRREIVAFSVEHEKFEVINFPNERMPLSDVSLAQVGGCLSLVLIPSHSYIFDITLWRLIDRNDIDKASWTKEVFSWPFLKYGHGFLRCSDFGLVSYIRSSDIDTVTIDFYDLATDKEMELELDNTEGALKLTTELRPYIMVKNLMPLKRILKEDEDSTSTMHFASLFEDDSYEREVGFSAED